MANADLLLSYHRLDMYFNGVSILKLSVLCSTLQYEKFMSEMKGTFS